MTNPEGVPVTTNTADYPTRPCWTFTYRAQPYGPDLEHRVYVTRKAEALSRFHSEVHAALVVSTVFTEVPAQES